MSPALSRVTAVGMSEAPVAGPPSPENALTPVPATVVITPWARQRKVTVRSSQSNETDVPISATICDGESKTGEEFLGEGLQWQVFNSTETLLELKLATARSGLPSP